MTRHPGQPVIRRMPLTAAERRAMSLAVLERTTGSACRQARMLVGGSPDEPFDVQTAALVGAHLDQCPACRAVARTLTEARAVLAALAEIEPGGDFTTQVVAATSRRPASSRHGIWSGLSDGLAWAGTFRERAASAWERVLARPRLSVELAYLATVLLVIVIGNPALIADALSARTSGIVAGEVASGSAGGRQPGTTGSPVGSMGPAMVERAMRGVETTQATAAKGWNWLVDRTSTVIGSAWDWLRGLFGSVAEEATPSARTEPARPPVRDSQ